MQYELCQQKHQRKDELCGSVNDIPIRITKSLFVHKKLCQAQIGRFSKKKL